MLQQDHATGKYLCMFCKTLLEANSFLALSPGSFIFKHGNRASRLIAACTVVQVTQLTSAVVYSLSWVSQTAYLSSWFLVLTSTILSSTCFRRSVLLRTWSGRETVHTEHEVWSTTDHNYTPTTAVCSWRDNTSGCTDPFAFRCIQTFNFACR